MTKGIFITGTDTEAGKTIISAGLLHLLRSKAAFHWEKRVGYEIYKIALEKGLLLRPIGNVLYFLPPYIVNEEEISFMVNACFDSINEYFNVNIGS